MRRSDPGATWTISKKKWKIRDKKRVEMSLIVFRIERKSDLYEHEFCYEKFQNFRHQGYWSAHAGVSTSEHLVDSEAVS